MNIKWLKRGGHPKIDEPLQTHEHIISMLIAGEQPLTVDDEITHMAET